jgi:hypothetical protein
VDQAVEEGSRGQDDGSGSKAHPQSSDGTDDAVAFENQVIDGLLKEPEVGLVSSRWRIALR